jgi:hypothetical protein
MAMTLDGTNGVTFNDSSLQGAAASPFGLKNRIINGAMVIAQRGTSFSFASGSGAAFYGADRFNTLDYNWSAGSNITVSNETSVVPSGFTNSYKWANGATGLTFGSGGYQSILQLIEGFNIADCYSKTVTLSFWVRASTAGTYSVNFMNDSGSYERYIVKTYTINTANTWEQKTISIDMSAGTSAGTWNTTNGQGLGVAWVLGTASNRTGNSALDTWTTPGSYHFATTSSVQLSAIANSTFYITGVQLEIGSSATPFERRLYNQELANCQRYYFKDITSNNYGSFAMGSVYSATTAQIVYPHKVTMRTASPTVSVSGVAVQTSTTQTSNINTVAGSYPGFNSTLIELTVSGFTARDAVWLNSANNGATAFVSLDTEL